MTAGTRALGTGLLALSLATPAFAQTANGPSVRAANGYDGDIDLIRPFFSPEHLPGIDVPANERGGSFRGGIAFMYSNSPLVLYEFDEEVGSVIENRFTAFAGLSVDITRNFTARANIPLYYQWGTQVPRYASLGFAAGDLGVGVHWAFFRTPTVGLGARLDLTVPTGRRGFYAGERLPKLNPAFLMMFDVGRVRIASDLGVNVRFESVDTTEDLRLGSELVWNNGVRINVLRDRLDLGVSIFARFGFRDFFQQGESSGEAMLTASVRAAKFMWVDVGAGRGFTQGYGSTDVRAWGQLRFEYVRPPRPGDDDFVDPEGEAKGDQGGLVFNVRDIGKISGGDEAVKPPEEQWDEGEFARIESERIRIRYAIRFKVGTAQLLPESYPTLDFIADLLNSDARIAHVVIEGHASEDGAFDTNYKLSLDRAASIWKRIVEQGVHPSRISIRGMGEVMPAEATGGYDELEASRRVVFHIVRQYEEWETAPSYQLDMKYPWNGEPYEAVQPRMPSPDEAAGLPDLLKRPTVERENFDDVDFNAPPDEETLEDDGAPAPQDATEEAE